MDAYQRYVDECLIADKKPLSFAGFYRSLTFTKNKYEKYSFYADECSKEGMVPVSFFDFFKNKD
jgi:hypothetical protein